MFAAGVNSPSVVSKKKSETTARLKKLPAHAPPTTDNNLHVKVNRRYAKYVDVKVGVMLVGVGTRFRPNMLL